ncbi:MAG TPA: Bax inhibitor-1/YccA family protein [Gemmatimonadaceae bacterium]
MSLPYTGTLVRTGAERATLVRRTYSLVLASVIVTMGGVALGLSQPSLMMASAQHPFIAFFVGMAPLFMALKMRESAPRAIGLVFLFNVVMGVVISPAIFYYGRTQPGVIGQAGLLTLTSFAVLTAYAWLSKRDFSAWGSFFMVGLWVLIATSLLNMFFKNTTASLWLSAGTVLVFSGLLVFDTWRIRNVYGPDDYVPAAVQIYLDLLNMFLAILNLLGGRRN